MSTLQSLVGLAVFVAICLGVGALGAFFTAPALEPWYASLPKPSWTPPNWVFGPVWTALYIMMGVAAWLVWRELGGLDAASGPLALFGLQLLLNVAWTVIFFGFQRPGVAFAEILLLWLAVAATTISFWTATPPAGVLMIPYLVWITYAAALNYAIWRLSTTVGPAPRD